jgi:hypothetical protein
VLKGELQQGGERNAFPALWEAVLGESGAEAVDATVLVSDLLCHKDDQEQVYGLGRLDVFLLL